MTTIPPYRVQPLYPKASGATANPVRHSAIDDLPLFKGQTQFRIDQKTEALAKDTFKMARANNLGSTMNSLFAASAPGASAYAAQNLLSLAYMGSPYEDQYAGFSPSGQTKLDLYKNLKV